MSDVLSSRYNSARGDPQDMSVNLNLEGTHQKLDLDLNDGTIIEARETDEKATPMNATDRQEIKERLEKEVSDYRKGSPSRDLSAKYMKGAWPGESAGTASNNEQLKASIIEDKSSPVLPN